MKSKRAFFVSIVICTMANGCAERRGATVSAFGQGSGRTVPEFVKYFEDAGTAFDQHMKANGFSVIAKPVDAVEVGLLPVAYRETWYEGSGQNAGAIRIQARQPTENAAGLHVYVVWRAEGSSAYVKNVEKDAQALCVQLNEWWVEYQRKNPLGIN